MDLVDVGVVHADMVVLADHAVAVIVENVVIMAVTMTVISDIARTITSADAGAIINVIVIVAVENAAG